MRKVSALIIPFRKDRCHWPLDLRLANDGQFQDTVMAKRQQQAETQRCSVLTQGHTATTGRAGI